MKPRKARVLKPYRTPSTRLLVDLRGMREAKGVTLRQVEHEAGISNPSLCQIEHGCTPSLENALKIAAFVELPIQEIWALKGKASQ